MKVSIDVMQGKIRVWCVFLAGAGCGWAAAAWLTPAGAVAQAPTAEDHLAAELEAIKGKLPDQAHAMQDVGVQYSNLWFAGQRKNWPLAQFFWNETRSHLRWAVRIIPKRVDNAGKEIDLEALLQAFENSPLKQLQDAITANDVAAFEKAYRFGLETCYACHKASDKPFIRPQIPQSPESTIINFDPEATWPK